MDGKQIQTVTSEGLTYLDENGDEKFIDFSACHERALAEFMEPNNLRYFQEINRYSAEQLEESIQKHKKWKVVADRNILGEPMGTTPYIEFYTEPPIRFEFATLDEYHKTRFLLERNGWRTRDLT
ncbi:MAG: hypothetical protein KJ065_06465 [Anaerolineae bacterium]|nr:hypothetical protein [Anaerolineae bacterium]